MGSRFSRVFGTHFALQCTLLCAAIVAADSSAHCQDSGSTLQSIVGSLNQFEQMTYSPLYQTLVPQGSTQPIPTQLAPSPVSAPSPVQAPSPYIYTVGANNSYSTSQPIGLIESVTKDIVTLKP